MIGRPRPRATLAAGVTLYFIRHGETDWNRERRYQGQTDIPLNERGVAQAERNGKALRPYLAERNGRQFQSSPLSRAIATMRIVRRTLGLEPDAFAIEPALREVSYGHWEGQLQSDLPTIDPEGVTARAADPFGWTPRNGESYAALEQRVAPWLASLRNDTVAVSHGGVSRAIRGLIFGLPGEDVTQLDVPQDRVMIITSQSIDWI